MTPPTKFVAAEADRATLKLTFDTLEVLLGQNAATPLDEATANDSLRLAEATQMQLIDNQKTLCTYSPSEAALNPYQLEYPTQLARAIRCTSGFRGIVMKFPSSSTPPPTGGRTPTPADIRLPKLQIPMFSGNLEEWISFRDLFEKSIGNNTSLSKAQKLTYLKSYLTGEASRHVSTLVISDANYDVAWTTLTNRYQNDRELLFSILRRLMQQPNHTTPSAMGIRNLIDTTQGCIRSLEVISVPVQHWDAILVFTVFNKMDQASKELWEQSLPDSRVPNLKNLTDFLEQRARALAAGSMSTLPPRGKPDRNRAQTASVSSHHAAETNILESGILATARVQILDKNGEPIFARVLLDGGSPVSFIEESCARKLHLPLVPSTTEINGIGGASAGVSQATTTFIIKPYFKSKSSFSVKALVLKKITRKLPATRLNNSNWTHLQDLRLADPEYYLPGCVDILIGSDVFWNILQLNKITGPPNTPYAIRSALGWLVAGLSPQQPTIVSSFMVNINLEETVQKFWEAESVPVIPIQTKEEQACEENFIKTHSRDCDGRFIVGIPWKQPRPLLGNSRSQALQRLFQLERRFKGTHIREPEKLRELQQHREDYIKFMQEYEDMGHMTQVPNEELNKPAVYISHHFVLKELSSTTRLRVVFDASAKTSSGFSLNDAMMVGPTLQNPIQDILIRFRKHNVAFTADIAKMYRQIKMKEEDCDMQRILWRANPSSPVKEYRLCTVTYGTASAPYLAVKCLQQLAEDDKFRFPIASQIALNDFYVDDAATGCSNAEDAIIAIKQLNEMCMTAGFPLRKYSCNSEDVLQSIPEELREKTTMVAIDTTSNAVKTLGIYWNPKQDIYKFTIDLPNNVTRYTKRSILSEVSMIYDPIGWLSPVMLCAKLLIQDLWRAKVEWNEEAPVPIAEKWKQMKNSFKEIEKLSIPRCVIPGKPSRTILVGFCDSSSYGYSACVYTLCYYDNQPPYSALVAAKTKVAPMQAPTIPRLELNGALLLSSLLRSVLRAMKYEFDDVRAFTDSTIVLAWINSSPHRWKIYVRQRVQKILEYCPEAKWFHVRSEENCADCASRGLTPAELITHSMWWTGNAAMKNDQVSSMEFSEDVFDTVRNEEQQRVLVHMSSVDGIDGFISRFSSFRKLQRTTAWMYRFTTNSKSTASSRKFGPLSVEELQHALFSLMRYVQKDCFPYELSALQKGKSLPSTSKILSLSPFIDNLGVLRVGGRLNNANIHGDKKHPILLPPRHPVTKMIVSEYHQDFFHAGPQLLLALLQQRFWLINARDTIRYEVRKCPTCIRYKGETMKQIMADLPSQRVIPAAPFSKCGVDYAGPILTRPPIRSKTTLKSYLAIFVCFVTRALHIEVVDSLSTDSFLAALRRFTSRRGRPTDIFSDCGTNFVGANRALKELVKLCRSSVHNERIADECSSSGIQWHFNPPNSPHFGGLWEAGVRSVKYHLNRVMGSSRYTYEELLTLTTQIEGLLNSRPLAPASSDPDDLQALTPAHFLCGRPLAAVPEPELCEIKESRLSRWQLLQQQKQHFWRRWSREYITRLQQRPKWMQVTPVLKVNDMVIIKEDNLPPSRWSLGRIIAVHPGADGLVRVATVKTCQGEYRRAIHKLCLLPFDQTPPPSAICDAEEN